MITPTKGKNRPTISTGPASHYAASNEIIREVSNGNIGCLLSIRTTHNGKLIVEVYRVDDGVIVRADPNRILRANEIKVA